MAKARQRPKPRPACEVIDFDQGVVDSCPPHVRDELRAEMDMLTEAFARADDPTAIRRMARALVRGQAESLEERLRARRLAAMLRLKAKALAGED